MELLVVWSWSPRVTASVFAGLSYGSHTVGFTPPATLSRAAISHYNSPALHVHGSSSHAVAVSPTGHAHQERSQTRPQRPPTNMVPNPGPRRGLLQCAPDSPLQRQQ